MAPSAKGRMLWCDIAGNCYPILAKTFSGFTWVEVGSESAFRILVLSFEDRSTVTVRG